MLACLPASGGLDGAFVGCGVLCVGWPLALNPAKRPEKKQRALSAADGVACFSGFAGVPGRSLP